MNNVPASGYHWLASYPRSGNTWLRLALQSLMRGGKTPDFTARIDFAEMAGDRDAFDLLLNVDSAELTDDEIERLRPKYHALEASRSPAPILRMVHDAWIVTSAGEPLFPPACSIAAVYIVRDPRDVAVSLAAHLGIDLNRTIDLMGRDDARFTSRRPGGPKLPRRLLTWSDHVRSWTGSPVEPRVIRYEDMLADPVASIADVARHFGMGTTPEGAQLAAAATRFEALQAAEDRHGFMERPQTSERFFRGGIAGAWRDVLNPTQAVRIEADHASMMTKWGYL